MSEQNEQNTGEKDEFSNAFAEAAEARAPADERDELPDAPDDTPEAEHEAEAETEEHDSGGSAGADVWTGVPETARRAYQEALEERERLRHSVHSNAGRVSALQRKINELETQLGGHASATSQAAPSADTPTAQQVREAMQTPEQWASFSEEYPEVAKAVDARIQVQFNQIQSQIHRDLNPLREDAQRRAQVEAEQFQRSQYGALEQAHPQWRQTINTPEFQSWFQTQPASIQSLVESDYADDAIALLNFYSSAKGAPATSGRIHDIQAQRQRRLEQSVETRGRQGAERPLAEDDFSSAFKAAVAKKTRGNY